MKRMLVAMMTGALALGACEGGVGSQQAAVGEADLARYCELSQQLDEIGDQEIDVDFESATPDREAVESEFSDFVESQNDQLEELQRVAPEEISDDVETVVSTIREVSESGDLSAFDESAEADERLREFEREQCDGET